MRREHVVDGMDRATDRRARVPTAYTHSPALARSRRSAAAHATAPRRQVDARVGEVVGLVGLIDVPERVRDVAQREAAPQALDIDVLLEVRGRVALRPADRDAHAHGALARGLVAGCEVAV